MRLICPQCDGELHARDCHLAAAVARCPKCFALFALRAPGREGGVLSVLPRLEATCPAGVTVSSAEPPIRIEISGFSWVFLFLFPLGVVFLFLGGFGLWIAIAPPGNAQQGGWLGSLIVGLFSALSLAIGITGALGTISALIGRTTIEATANKITVTYFPLAWNRVLEFSVAPQDQLYCAQAGQFCNLVLLRADDSKSIVLSGSAIAVWFFEQQLERVMGIADRRVPEEWCDAPGLCAPSKEIAARADGLPLTCSGCAGGLTGRDVDLATAEARCPSCGQTFPVTGGDLPAERVLEIRDVTAPQPDRLIVSGGQRNPSFTWAWSQSGLWYVLLFWIGWSAGILFTLWIFTTFGYRDGALKGLLTLIFSTSLGYTLTACYVNSTTVELDGGLLRVSHGPLPLLSGTEQSLAEVSALTMKLTEGGPARNPYSYALCATLRDGSERVLVDGQVNPFVILYLQQELVLHLSHNSAHFSDCQSARDVR